MSRISESLLSNSADDEFEEEFREHSVLNDAFRDSSAIFVDVVDSIDSFFSSLTGAASVSTVHDPFNGDSSGEPFAAEAACCAAASC